MVLGLGNINVNNKYSSDMKEKIRKICAQLNDGQIAASQATEQLLDLFSVSKRALLADLLEQMNSTHCEYHADIVEGEMHDC